MKEKFKAIGKARLKCFKNDSPRKTNINNTSPLQTNKDRNNSSSAGEDESDVYKSLLNDVPCTSNEKGTMTDSSLCKPAVQKPSSVPTTYSNLKNILQSISKNKADNKVPLVILSKSPTSSKSNKISKNDDKDMNVFDFVPSEFEGSESEDDSEKAKDDANIALNTSNDSFYSTENIMSPFSKSSISSPDFKGFSSPQNKLAQLSNVKHDRNNEKFSVKKIFSNKDKELLSPEKEATTLDHPYSHGSSQEKARYVSQSSEPSLTGTEYQRFVNRSVFGSPSLSKNPPDIMLHNDKINILRQMSQVFNDEKIVKCNEPKVVDKENQDKVNKISDKVNKISDHGTVPDKLSAVADITATKSSKTSTTTATTKTTKMLTTTTSSAKSTKTIETAAKIKPIRALVSDATTKTTKTITTTAAATNTTNTISTAAAETSVLTLTTTTANALVTTPTKYLVTPVVSEKETSPINDDATVNKVNTVRKKYMTRKSSKLEHNSEPEEPKSSENNNPVHLVSSYSINKNESIKVKSYSGTKGEEVDVIDGFTFFSFNTESEMMNYCPSKSKRKLRKKKNFIASEEECKVSERTEKTVIAQTDIDDKSVDESSTDTIDNNNQSEVKFIEDSPVDPLKKKKPQGKTVESSAFASNDLDQYLTEHAELKISFAIPKCSATEEGVTKFDETGKPLPIQEISATSSKLDSKPIHNSKTVNSILEKPSLPVPLVKKSVPTLPLVVPISKSVESVKVAPRARKPSPVSNGSDLFVKRGGNLLPLSSVFKRATNEDAEEKNAKFEMIYVYHGGRLLTLGGSLTKISPSNSGSIKAKVALPRGHSRLIKHAKRVSSRKVKAVEINEDLAKFALSALKTPTKDDKLDFGTKSEVSKEEKSYVKPSKDNILDILAAKFSIDKDSKWDVSDSKNATDSPLYPKSNLEAEPSDKLDMETGSNIPKKADLVSKIKWNQDDILKKKDSTSSLEQSKGFKKNINRFPSLSREMKRLNMNFVTMNKESDEEVEESSANDPLEPCTNEHCSMGCVCDSLRCRKKVPDHCGKTDCMFKCLCTVESWKEGKKQDGPINMVSIFNADRENDKLALKEKDFKKTIVQTGSDVYLIGGEKKKRDIRIPQRYRDTNIWKSPSPPLAIYNSMEEDKSNKENVPILPNSYKHYIKDFSLNVPWYDLNGASIWCMLHSCYDCSCLQDPSFFIETDQEVLSDCDDDVVIVDNVNQGSEDPTLSKVLMANCILCYTLNMNLISGGNSPTGDRGKWSFKHWIHNSNVHCSRTTGYDIKEKITKDINHNMKDGFSLPLPKAPLVMGITLKNKVDNKPHKKTVSKGSTNPKAIFHDGLGPGLSLATISHADEIFSKYAEYRHLSNIFLKTCPEPSQRMDSTRRTELPVNLEDVQKIENKLDADEPLIEESNPHLMEFNDKDESKKCFSLYEMIKEEEKRGELELDLSPKEEGKAILITESRFRKLINMNIVGIIGLNKSGRCIISTVKSSEDLIKMQRLQQLISNNTIDVGPNMKEIFAPSSQLDQKIRYVMIRCDVGGRWEIVGVVQRKAKDNENFAPPKQKRQKTKQALPSLIMNHLKYKPKILNETTGEWNDGDINQSSVGGSTPNTDNSESETETLKSNEEALKGKISAQTLPQNENLILEEGDKDSNLPCISSVISGDDPDIEKIIGSPIKVLQSEQNKFSERNIIPTSANYILNQPSGKIFGGKNQISSEAENSGAGTAAPINPKTAKLNPNPLLPGTMKIESRGANAKVLFYPRLVTDGSSQIRTGVPMINGPHILANSSQIRLNGSQIRLNSNHIRLNNHQVRLTSPQVRFNSAQVRLNSSQLRVNNPQTVVRPNIPFIRAPGVNTPSLPGIVSTSNDKIKMLLFPSTTNPGNSILIPTLTDVPVSYSWVVNDPVNTSRAISPQVLSLNMSTKPNINVPLISTTAAAKQIPQVQTTSSGVSILPIVISKTDSPGGIQNINSKSSLPVGKLSRLPSGNFNLKDGKISSLTNFNLSVATSSVGTTTHTVSQAKSQPVSSVVGTPAISQSTSQKAASNCSITANTLSQLTSQLSSLITNSPTYTFSQSINQETESLSISSLPTETEPSEDPLNLNILQNIKPDINNDDSQINNTDIKCLSVIHYDKCTAVDLLVNFKSIKVNWLSGTIKRNVLLNIFKMSRKINAPVSLSAKNDTIHRSSFLGMHHFAVSDGKVVPILILGTKLNSVYATLKQGTRELFRSNTVKYLIRDEDGEISSYTYDAKGDYLIRIASKKNKESGIQLGIGEKLPIDKMRDSIDVTGLNYNKRTACVLNMKPSVKQACMSNTENDEIVILDSDEEDANNTKKNQEQSVLSKLPESSLLKGNKMVHTGSDLVSFTISDTFISDPGVTDGSTSSDLKRKYDPGNKSSSSEEKSILYSDAVKKFKNCHSKLPTSRSSSKGEQAARIPRCKPVLKIPNPFKSTKIAESQKKDETKFDGEEEAQFATGETSPSSKTTTDNTQNSKKDIVNDKLPKMNFSSRTDHVKTSPNKTHPSWGLFSPSEEPITNMSITSQKYQDKERNTNEANLNKNEPFKNKLNANFNIKTSEPMQSSADIDPLSIDDSQLVLEASTSNELSLSLENNTVSDLNKNLEEFIDVEWGLPVRSNLTEAHSNLISTENTTYFKRKLGKGNKPCPLSKKPGTKKKQCASSTPSTPPDNSFRFSFKNKAKSCSPLPKKNSPIGNRNAMLSSPSSQEFQQVFSGAPQFWLMDNTEKHNTLERIRRKGLAKMLENLYTKATEIPPGKVRLPPKHVILKESEKVIMEIRSKDIKLAKMEITLREKKTQLLNTLSDILKDCDEEVQKQFELWISSSISNPTSKNKFEESWKPQNVVFEDEHIFSSTCGELTVSGTDITSYFATHTAGFSPTKSPPKFKTVKSQLSRRKFPFHLNSSSKVPPHHQTLKNKLTNVLKHRKPSHVPSISHSLSLENLTDLRESSSSKEDIDSRWIDLISPSKKESSVKRIMSDDESISSSSNSTNSSVKDSSKNVFLGVKESSECNDEELSVTRLSGS